MNASTTTPENGQELIVEFVDEAVESLREVPSLLETYRLVPQDDAPIHAVFRAVHSIKGCAGFLGLTTVKQFAHSLENTMDEVRKGKLRLTEDLQRLLVTGIDLLEAMLGQTLEGELAPPLSTEEQQLLADIDRVSLGCRTESSPEDEILGFLHELSQEMASSGIPQAANWAKRCQDLAEQTAEQDENESAEEESSQAALGPTPHDFVNVSCRVAGTDVTSHLNAVLSIFCETEKNGYRDELAEPFFQAAKQFGDWAKQNQRPDLAAALQVAAKNLKTIVDSPLDVDASLLSVIWDDLRPEFMKFEGAPERNSSKKDSQSTSSEQSSNVAAKDKSSEPTGDSKSGSDAAGKKSRLVRIKEERLDEFMKEVSRLFITNELIKDLHSRMSGERGMPALVEELRQIHSSFAGQSRALQKSVLELRRVAVAGLFSKFPRMARTLAGQLGKKVDVRLVGEETEIDKSLVEDLDAPLTHMIRNSVDHGFETPEERLAAGKPESGTLTLGAELTRTHAVITIQDDGRGIDPTRLRNKAIEKELITPEQARAMSDAEAVRLIFHAGFSTAEKLSEVSGRGVGMDVVRTNLLEHNGEIHVDSVVGVGSTFRLEIPLREAVLVIDGLMLEQSGDAFVLPFEHIREITELRVDELKPVQGSQVATVRGKTYAAVSLADVLGIASDRGRRNGRILQAVLVGCKYGEACLLVDRVLGHRQIVLNSLKDILPQTRNLAGVAQLGGGHLALVLSVEDIVRSLRRSSKQSPDVPKPAALASLQPA